MVFIVAALLLQHLSLAVAANVSVIIVGAGFSG
jgi:hypothetical protein